MRFLKITAILLGLPLLAACQSTSTPQSVPRPAAEGQVVVGYIAVKGSRMGGFDVESRISHLPSSSQIGWMHENYNQLQRTGQLATGMSVEIVAYGRDRNTVIWSNTSVSGGQHRTTMSKSLMRQTGIICARVTGYRILNVENLQMGAGKTSWCDEDFASHVDKPWMQGLDDDKGYGFPFVLEPLM
jgi:hypothetical protein